MQSRALLSLATSWELLLQHSGRTSLEVGGVGEEGHRGFLSAVMEFALSLSVIITDCTVALTIFF